MAEMRDFPENLLLQILRHATIAVSYVSLKVGISTQIEQLVQRPRNDIDVMDQFNWNMNKKVLRSVRLVCKRWYRISGSAVADVTPKSLSNGKDIWELFPCLATIDLASCSDLTDEALQLLTSQRPGFSPLLSSLRICRTPKVTDTGILSLASLSSLTTLAIGSCQKVSSDGLVLLLQGLSSLTSLSLRGGNAITDAVLEAASSISSLASLELLWCDCISDAGLVHLERLGSLTDLNIYNCKEITGSGLRPGNFHRLRLDWCEGILENSLELLDGSQNLTHLSLANCPNVSLATCHIIATLPNLESLNLSGCDIQNEGIEVLSRGLQPPSRALRRLRVLLLGGCEQLTEHALSLIAQFRNLECLVLAGCYQIGDEGIAQSLAHLSSLKVLDVSLCSKLTDASVHSICANHKQLEELNLQGCPVTDACIDEIVELNELRKLDVRGTKIAKDTIIDPPGKCLLVVGRSRMQQH